MTLLLRSPCRPRRGRLALALAILLAWAGFAHLPARAAPPRRVLVLQSYERGTEPYETFTDAFRAALVANSPAPVELHEISLATALYPGVASEEPFLSYLSAFQDQRRFDLVVVIGGAATRFVQRHRGRVFSATPVLIAGADQRLVAPQALTPADATVSVGHDMAASFTNIFQLLPETDRVVVVLGRTPLEQYWADELQREFEPFAGRARLRVWNGLPYAELLRQAAALPPRAAIFYGMYVVDADGVPHADDAALDALRAVATAPLFGLFDSQLGRGIVGGPLIPLGDAGRAAGDAAIRLLAGETPAAVRLPPIRPTAPVFDGRELARWEIDARRLPPGSAVRFLEPTLWQAHRWKILGVAAVGALQGALILALSTALIGRRRAERELRRSREQYALAVDGTRDGLFDWDLPSGRLALTSRGRALLQIPDGAPADRFAAWEERIHPDDRGALTTALQAHLAGRSTDFRAEHRVWPEDGGPRWLLARGKALRDPDGRATRMVGALTDVTERRLAEDAVRDLGRRLIAAQEEERARLARELHDDLTQRLAHLAIDAGHAERVEPGSPREDTLRRLREGLVRLSEDAHALSYRLHPSLLEDLGLAAALQAECERFSRQSGLAVDLALREVPEQVPRDAALCLFRVAQEALRNVDRHARAHGVEVRLRGLEGGLQLAVRDDGVGFEPAAAGARRSLGHASMEERVRLAGGELDIESAPGQGTTIVAWVPLGREQA